MSNTSAWVQAEVKTAVVKKYYTVAGQRIGMRENGVVYWLHSDHLGSTSLTTNSGGGIHAQQRYFPYGEVRWQSGSLPTDRQYTDQRREAVLGDLYDYRARFYSPRLGRFVSADTLVPGVGSQHLSRYMYVTGNPVRYDDPTGHFTEEEIRQHLIGYGGLTEEEATSVIHMWKTQERHKDWWALLLEAQHGDRLVAYNGEGDSYWTGEFFHHPGAGVAFTGQYKTGFMQREFKSILNFADFYSDDVQNADARIRQDIILTREGTKLGLATGGYVFWKGTDLFAGGIPERRQPSITQLALGIIEAAGGAYLGAQGVTKVIAGLCAAPIGTPMVVFGGIEALFGIGAFGKGMYDSLGYFSGMNKIKYIERRLDASSGF